MVPKVSINVRSDSHRNPRSSVTKAALLRKKVLTGIRERAQIRKGARVLVGVSGGPDSIVLLHILFSLKHELGLHLMVAHFDHDLRVGSKRDACFVRSVAADFGIPFIDAISTLPYPSQGSVEAMARERRYAFFVQSAGQFKADVVALGHTRDDQAETVLMRILRGTGTTGLRAILPVRRIDGVTFVRPLIDITRLQVEAYLKSEKLKFITDPTNRSLIYFRNRIRHKILPFLEKELGGQVRSHLSTLAFLAGQEHDFIEASLDKILVGRFQATRNGAKVSLKGWGTIHPALTFSFLRRCLLSVKGDLLALTAEHIIAIERLIVGGVPGSEVHLPEGIVVRKISHLFLEIKKYCL